MARPRRPLSTGHPPDSCSMSLFVTHDDVQQPDQRRRWRLVQLITRQFYRSFQIGGRRQPPSSGTSGPGSGGSTGTHYRLIIHSGLLPDCRKTSHQYQTLGGLLARSQSWSDQLLTHGFGFTFGSMARSRARMASALILASNSYPLFRITSRIVLFGQLWLRSGWSCRVRSLRRIRNTARARCHAEVMSSNRPIRDGGNFRNQMWASPGCARLDVLCAHDGPWSGSLHPLASRQITTVFPGAWRALNASSPSPVRRYGRRNRPSRFRRKSGS